MIISKQLLIALAILVSAVVGIGSWIVIEKRAAAIQHQSDNATTEQYRKQVQKQDSDFAERVKKAAAQQKQANTAAEQELQQQTKKSPYTSGANQ